MTRLAARLPPAAGAIAGQVVLALGSFLLQLVAARALGPGQFGVFAMLFGAIVMATALSSGLVGDSLTVLDRHDPVVRSALTRTAAAVIGIAALGGLALALAGDLDPAVAVALAVATTAFMAADLGRRLLMAAGRFWALVLVDALGLVVALTVVAAAAATGSVGLADLLVALAAGQATACACALACLPAHERARPAYRRGGTRTVLAFGGYRAVQQFVRPTTLNAARWLVLVAAGAAAVGELEAARLLVAPAMLLVQGVGAYLFASYAAGRTTALAPLLRRADRAAATLLAGATTVALVAAVTVPLLTPVLTPGFEVAALAVLGWGAYAASCAAVLPYGSLAAVRGRQAAVLGLRLVDALASLALVGGALLLLGAPASVTPWLLACGSFAGGLVCRQALLVPLLGPAVASPAAPGLAEVPA